MSRFTDDLLGSLFLGGMFYLFYGMGQQDKQKQIEEEARDEKIRNLEKMVRNFNAGR